MPVEDLTFKNVIINRWTKENFVTSRGEIKEDEIEIFPNSIYLENQFIKVDVNPPLNPNQYKYLPNEPQFDAGVTFDGVNASIRETLSLGFEIGPKRDILLNYCDIANAWFDFVSGKIEVCKGGAGDADVPVHEYGHADLFYLLPNLDDKGPDFNAVRFHEYYGDVNAATTNKNWAIGEYAAIAFKMTDAEKNGIRNPLSRVIKWEEAKNIEDPHIASLAFTGVVARIWQRLAKSNGRFKLPDDAAFLLIRALVRNQPNFLPRPNDLSAQDFYWSLAGSLNGLYTSGKLGELIGGGNVADWAGFLQMAIRQECVRTGLISEEEVVKGVVRIKDKPVELSTGASSQTFHFYGGSRRVIQQTTKLIFKKDGVVVNSEEVIVAGHSITQYALDGGTQVTLFDGVRKLGNINLEVEVGPNMMNNYIPQTNVPALLMKAVAEGIKLRAAVEKKVPISAQMNAQEQKRRLSLRYLLFKRAEGALKASNLQNLKPRLVLIDGKDNVQYQFNFGLVNANVDLRTGEVDFVIQAFID